MALGFVLKLNDGETWRDLVRRHAAPEGLDHECLSEFDMLIASGEDEDSAAFCALYEWDCCPLGQIEGDGATGVLDDVQNAVRVAKKATGED